MQYDFTLLAGESKQEEVKGRFIKYKSGTGLIRVRMSKGGYVDLLPGQGISNVAYDNFIITDRSNAANCGVVLAGDYEFKDDRISGTVDVVDGGKARVLTNSSFGLTIPVVAGGALFNNHQLWNPAGSGKRVIINNMTFTSGNPANSAYMDLLRPAPLATLYGNGASKQSGGATSVATSYTSQTAGVLFTSGLWFLTAGQQYKPTEPIVILPGAGLTLTCQTANATSYWGLEYFEESSL